MLATFVGISGSGKSTISKEFVDAGWSCVNPDSIRKILTGNISDQSKNKEVFEIAYSLTRDLLSKNQNVIFDATGLNIDSILKLKEFADGAHEEFIVYNMLDSRDSDLCYSRVKNDILKGKDRADVPEYVVKNQQMKYFNVIAKVKSLDFTMVDIHENNI